MPANTKACRVCGAEYSGGEAFCPVDGGRLSSASEIQRPAGSDPIVGTTLDGRYRVLRAIGEGGMGIVYQAEHVKLDKPVAIKVLRDDFTRRADVVERFRQEARSASRIGHPNIIDVSDFGETPGGGSYLVMEMLEGEDMADLLAREYVLSPLRATGITFQVCKALAAAHRAGIVHRDLKPENLFVMEKAGQADFIKIVDFGVAKMTDIELGGGGRKLTTTGMIFGTPEYMSPEQARGNELDHRVDVYATGVILFELVTGRVPFAGENFMEILNKHAQDPVPQLQRANPATRVSPELEAVIFRAMRKDPDERFQDMEAMAEALSRCPEMPARVPSDSELPPDWSMSAPPAPPASMPGEHVPPTAPTQSEVAVAAEDAPAAAVAAATSSRARSRLAVAAALVVGAGLALALPRPSAPTSTGAAEGANVEGDEVHIAQPMGMSVAEASAPAPAPSAEAPGAGERAAAERGASSVTVHVETHPSGAKLSVAGQGVVCEATPCDLELPRGVEAELGARRGRMRAETTLVPNAATEVRMTLRRPAPPAGRSAAPVARKTDLKVPEMFR